jgi:hypothetical protein
VSPSLASAKTEPTPSGVNFVIVLLPVSAKRFPALSKAIAPAPVLVKGPRSVARLGELFNLAGKAHVENAGAVKGQAAHVT